MYFAVIGAKEKVQLEISSETKVHGTKHGSSDSAHGSEQKAVLSLCKRQNCKYDIQDPKCSG